MQLFPSEIKSIDDMGELDSEPVKMVSTIGGFYLAVGKKHGKDFVLGSASHPAILRHSIKKSYSSFKPSLMKSETDNAEVVERTQILPQELKKSGHELFEIEELGSTRFSLTKHSKEIAKFDFEPNLDNGMILSSKAKKVPEGVLRTISELCVSKALVLGKKVGVNL
jgi:hypothetical protein